MHTEYFVPNSVTFYLRNDSSDNITIDNVSVKQVDPNDRWELGTDWSYGNNKVIGNGTQAEVTQQNVDLPDLKKFKVTFTIEDYVSGDVRIRFRGGTTVNGTNRSGNGTYTETLTSTGHTNVKIDGGTSFTGSVTNISVVEVQGDKPRLNYDPLNPTCPHLLLEPQSTNEVVYSNDFSQWTDVGGLALTNNIAKSPDGSVTADGIQDTTGGTFKRLRITKSSISPNSTFTASFFVKKETSEINYGGVALVYQNVSTATSYGIIDAVNGTIVNGGGSITPIFNVTDFGDYWRFEMTSTDNSSNTAVEFSIYGTLSNNGTSLGTGVGSVRTIWGAQLEQQSYATSYIPTAGSQETRVGETCTNAGNVNTFNSQEGVLYCEIAALANAGGDRRISISDGTVNNRLLIYYYSVADKIAFLFNTGGVLQLFDTQDINATDYNKIALRWKLNDTKIYINGTLAHIDTSISVPSAGTFKQIQFDDLGSNDFYGKVKSLATYNRALTDNELYTITSTQYSAYSGMVAALGNYTIPC
jgi:hypothetical protein